MAGPLRSYENQIAIEALVKRALESGDAQNPMRLDLHTLSAVIVQGIEGIMHTAPLESAGDGELSRIRENVISYVTYILGSRAKNDR